jgi:hypothetical protein
MVQSGTLPGVIMELTVREIGDPVAFLLGAVHKHDWLWEYIRLILRDPAPPQDNAVMWLRHAITANILKPDLVTEGAKVGLADEMELEEGGGVKGVAGRLGGERFGTLGLLKLVCAMVARGGMHFTLEEVMGDKSHSVPPLQQPGSSSSSGEASVPLGGLLGIIAGEGCRGGREGQRARQLALCALVLWPRIKAAVYASAVTSAIKGMWAAAEGGGGWSWQGTESVQILQFIVYLVTR